MKSKKVIYEKQLVRKKMISLIIYGIIDIIERIIFIKNVDNYLK